jgi:hypothetical protein
MATNGNLKHSGVSFCFLFILSIVNEKMIFLWSHTCKAGNPDSMCQCNDFLFFVYLLADVPIFCLKEIKNVFFSWKTFVIVIKKSSLKIFLLFKYQNISHQAFNNRLDEHALIYLLFFIDNRFEYFIYLQPTHRQHLFLWIISSTWFEFLRYFSSYRL